MPTITDYVWGVERYRESPAYGELVVGVIFLWSVPGGLAANAELTGALNHGTGVLVTNEVERGGIKWCRVEADVIVDGQIYPQHGWLAAGLLKEAGSELYN